MQIRKWYADCVTADGTVFIGYSAQVGLGPITLPYQATLTGGKGEPLSQQTAWRTREMPDLDADGATWRCPKLNLDGRWSRASPPFHRVLLDTQSVTIDWRCHMPRAAAAVRVGDRDFEGPGYLEELRLRGNPTGIPIHELRWGRFLGEADSVVWIDWRGPNPLTVVLHNGIEAEGGRVTDEGVRFADFRLALGGEDAWTLRDEVVEESVFPNQTWLRPFLPRALARLHEVKWAAPGCLQRTGASTSRGWVIYERVVWP